MFAQLALEFDESQRLLLFFHTKDRQKSKLIHKSAKKGSIEKIKKNAWGYSYKEPVCQFSSKSLSQLSRNLCH